jgi:hypothetical protein
MGDDSDFDLHLFLVVVLINVFGVVEHVIQPLGIVEIDVKRDLAGPIAALGTVRSYYLPMVKWVSMGRRLQVPRTRQKDIRKREVGVREQ